MNKSILKILVLIIFLVGCSNQKNDSFSDENWISLAMESEKYIQQSKYLSDEGEIWKVMPDSLNSQGDKSLYSGAPGIILFYLELHNATKDTIYLEEAKLGADYLINTLQDTLYTDDLVGLYTGLAGIGFAITEVYKSTNDQTYQKAAIKIIDLLEASATKTEQGIHWASMSDIVYGSSGIGLYLQYVADELKLPKADSLAVLVAEGLLETAIHTLNGLRWKFMPNYNIYMDNFSHGTSGVAYFLSQTYKRTQNQKYLDAAVQATKLLDSLTNEKGYIPHHLPGGEDLYYMSWCHGPPGTSRLYYSLFEATNDEEWLNKMTSTANHLMDEGIHEHETPGYWNNVGKCCGAVGVAEYYLWLYDITGNKDYLQFSDKMTQQLIASSTQEDNYLKWIHAENRTSPDIVAAQTGLMQGSAGIGLWFLQLNARKLKKDPLICLPDKPKVRVRE